MVGKYANGGPFESQGASGPFAKQGACATVCQRVASFVCPPPVQDQRQTPGVARASSSSSNSTSLDECLHSCEPDAVQSSCIRTLIDPYIACYLSAPLSCDRNGGVQAEGCPDIEIKQLSQCGAVTQTPPEPDTTDNGPGSTPVTRADAGR